MAITEEAGSGEVDAVVVETTPRVRRNHPKWTKARLGPWTDTELPVRISGWTFFDTEHRNHLGTFRSTLWEIHPVTKIEVLKDGVWVIWTTCREQESALRRWADKTLPPPSVFLYAGVGALGHLGAPGVLKQRRRQRPHSDCVVTA
jgi:hypothetical protein